MAFGLKYLLLFISLISNLLLNQLVLAQSMPTYSNFNDFTKDMVHENDTTYVINFWATWCKPCVKELPYFDSLFQSSKQEPLKIILVSLDFQKQKDSHLIPFIKKHNLKPQVVLLADADYDKWLPLVDNEWSGSIPATLLVRSKKKRFVEQEFENAEELFQFVNQFISSP